MSCALASPLPITDEMRESHDRVVDEIVNRQNGLIEEATKRGLNHTCFVLYPTESPESGLYWEVRALFERAGYHIQPTGCIGGVWQHTHDISW